MTYENSQRCKLAFIRHRQFPRGKLVRAPQPVRHTDEVPYMRDTLSDLCTKHSISATSQLNGNGMNALVSASTEKIKRQTCSIGLSAGLSLSCQSQLSLKDNISIFKADTDPDANLLHSNATVQELAYSSHSDLTHSGGTVPLEQSAHIESYYTSFQDVIPSLIKIDDYLFYKIYRIGRYCSTGVIVLPPSEIKHYANVKENTLVFYVVQGEIYVTVNHYTFMAAKAGHIVIPRSSTYQLANKMDSDAILYFTHIVDPMWYQ